METISIYKLIKNSLSEDIRTIYLFPTESRKVERLIRTCINNIKDDGEEGARITASIVEKFLNKCIEKRKTHDSEDKEGNKKHSVTVNNLFRTIMTPPKTKSILRKKRQIELTQEEEKLIYGR